MLRTNFDLSIIKIPNTIMQVFLGHHAVGSAGLTLTARTFVIYEFP